MPWSENLKLSGARESSASFSNNKSGTRCTEPTCKSWKRTSRGCGRPQLTTTKAKLCLSGPASTSASQNLTEAERASEHSSSESSCAKPSNKAASALLMTTLSLDGVIEGPCASSPNSVLAMDHIRPRHFGSLGGWC